MNTISSISAPVFRINPALGSQHQDLLQGRRSSDEKRLEIDDQNRQAVTESTLRGEWLESAANDKRYQPLYTQNIDPQNRAAISNYQSAEATAIEQGSLGRLIDRYI